MHTSHELFDAYKRSSLPNLTRLVLFVIVTHQNYTEKRPAFPSIALLAKETDMCERAVKKHIALAADGGWLRIEKARGAGKQYVHNVYHLTIPPGFELAADSYEEKPDARDAPSSITESKLGARNDINLGHHMPTNSETNREEHKGQHLVGAADEIASSSRLIESQESQSGLTPVPAVVLGFGRKHGIERISACWDEFCQLDGMQRSDPDQYIGVFFDRIKETDDWQHRTKPEVWDEEQSKHETDRAVQPRAESRVPHPLRDMLRQHDEPDRIVVGFDRWYPTVQSHRPDLKAALRFFSNSAALQREWCRA